MGSQKGISSRNSPPPRVIKTVKKQEFANFTVGKILITVAVVITILAIVVPYVDVNYYLSNRISTKSELPTISTKFDPVCISSKFQNMQ